MKPGWRWSEPPSSVRGWVKPSTAVHRCRVSALYRCPPVRTENYILVHRKEAEVANSAELFFPVLLHTQTLLKKPNNICYLKKNSKCPGIIYIDKISLKCGTSFTEPYLHCFSFIKQMVSIVNICGRIYVALTYKVGLCTFIPDSLTNEVNFNIAKSIN